MVRGNISRPIHSVSVITAILISTFQKGRDAGYVAGIPSPLVMESIMIIPGLPYCLQSYLI